MLNEVTDKVYYSYRIDFGYINEIQKKAAWREFESSKSLLLSAFAEYMRHANLSKNTCFIFVKLCYWHEICSVCITAVCFGSNYDMLFLYHIPQWSWRYQLLSIREQNKDQRERIVEVERLLSFHISGRPTINRTWKARSWIIKAFRSQLCGSVRREHVFPHWLKSCIVEH